jgi:hypothetical protein
MADDNNVSRRNALKGLAIGLGAAGSLPILNNAGMAQQAHVHEGHATAAQTGATAKKPEPPKFFNAAQMALISTISEIIIPTDDHSPGAIAAEVPAFADLMISESPAETKKLWTDGLAAVDSLSQSRYQTAFTAATAAQQTGLLTEISKNEASPKTIEERFFRAIKNMTIDGYYTSKVGIHQELRYKGNTYLKEFKGCTHPEHIKG